MTALTTLTRYWVFQFTDSFSWCCCL